MAESIKSKYEIDPELAKLNKSLSVQEYYINLAIVENKEQREKEKKLEKAKDIDDIRGTYEEIHGTKTTILVEDIFKNSKNPKRVLLLGRAGIGKSTFCKYVINRWAQGELWQEYKLVILIQLRKLTKERYSANRYSVIDLVDNEYLIDVTPSDDIKKKFKDQCKNGEILWILDGYDEFVQNIPATLKGPFNEIVQQYNHILTSRPYAIDLRYDIKMEITGFTDDNIAAFVKQSFKPTSEASHDTQLKCETVLSFLKSNPTIWGIAHIPINLELICSYWNALKLSKKEKLTVTDLYHRLVLKSCLVYLKKPDQLHEKLTDEEIEDKCAKHLEFLEKVAYGALQSNIIIMDIKYLSEIAKKTNFSKAELEKKEFLELGLLKFYDDNLEIQGAPIKKQYYFLHLSFQEFFAARHLVRILDSQDEKEKKNARHFIRENKYNQRFTLVFIFAFGLLRHQNNCELIKDFWYNIEREAKDLIGLRHIKLLIECLDEMDGNAYAEIRTHCIASIATWIKRAVKIDHTIVMRHLYNSFTRTTTLAREEEIIITLKELFQWADNDVCFSRSILLCVSHMPQPSTELVSLVMECVRKENYEFIIRDAACKALGEIGKARDNSEVIDALLEVLTKHKESEVKKAACEVLGQIGQAGDNSKVIDALLEVLTKHKESKVKEAACEALGEIGQAGDNSKVINALLEVLNNDKDGGVKCVACKALGEIGKAGDNSKVINALLKVLTEDKDRGVKVAACRALGEIGQAGDNSKVIDDLLEVLTKYKDSGVKWAVCNALGEICKAGDKSKVIDDLLKVLNNDKDGGVKCVACKTLGEIGKAGDNSKVINALLKVLTDDKERGVKWAACKALGEISKAGDNIELINALLEVLNNNQDCSVRQSACHALGEIGKAGDNSEVINALLRVLHNDEDSDWVKEAVCRALGEIGKAGDNSKVINALLKVLTEHNGSEVKRVACEALGKIGKAEDNSKVIDALLKVLTDDKDREVKRAACNALGEIGKAGDDHKVIDTLVGALKSDSYDVSFLFRALKKCLHDLEAIEGLKDELISTLDSFIKRYLPDLQEVPPDIFLRSYLISQKETWLHLAIFVALIQGVAVTVEDKLVVCGAKEPIPLGNHAEDLLNKLRDACQKQERELFGEA